jgi:4-oxalocrotonate tautomerase
MPIVRVSWAAGRTIEQKRELVERITEAVRDVCGFPTVDGIHVLLEEYELDNWARGGELIIDRKQPHPLAQRYHEREASR